MSRSESERLSYRHSEYNELFIKMCQNTPYQNWGNEWHALSPGAGLSTHLTQGEEDVIRGTCMFVVNIFPHPFWIGFKRLSEESLLSLDSICREGFVNG